MTTKNNLPEPIDTLNDYQRLALKTEANDFDSIKNRLINLPPEKLNILLNTILLVIDCSKRIDLLKKVIFYGQTEKLDELEKFNPDAVNQGILSLLREGVVRKNLEEIDLRLIHGIFGVCTESGELFDAMFNGIAFGAEKIDKVNIAEEGGDVMWYLPQLCEACGITMQDLAETNIAKLFARYGEKFSQEAAENRNLENENNVLTSSLTLDLDDEDEDDLDEEEEDEDDGLES